MIQLPTADRPFELHCGDCLEAMSGLPDDSVDLVFCSPPYEACRTYGIGFSTKDQAWVDWMFQVVKAAAPKVKGLIAIVCEGQTRNYRNSVTPFLLIADLHRAGFNLRKPPIFKRVGIPGSGGPDWLRNDYEPIVCITRPGRLPWSDNTACGHPPKWAPGGAMAHRMTDGTRVNEWGSTGDNSGGRVRQKNGKRPVPGCPSPPKARLGRGMANGIPGSTKGSIRGRRVTSGHANGDTPNDDTYLPPALANPGNVIECIVGGGVMGHELAHENEAPFPLDLALFFVKSFCPPDGIVLDPFSGSGTTGHAALECGRRYIGIDIRQSQIDLTRRRLESGITPGLFS